MTMTTKPGFTGVTIGPDGTIIGRRVTENGAQPFISSLAMLWIELAWDEQHPECVRRLCLTQDGLGTPGAIPPEADYLTAIRASSYEGRVKMLELVRRYVSDTYMAELLGVPLLDLRRVLKDAYDI